MVAPLPIEEQIKASELISQVCLVGDGRKYLSALITLAEAPLAELLAGNGKGNGNSSVIDGMVVKDAATLAAVKQYIDGINKTLASYEQIKRFTILSREFSVADGEMTPTLKMKRNVIEARYKDVIDGMYAG